MAELEADNVFVCVRASVLGCVCVSVFVPGNIKEGGRVRTTTLI